MCFLLILQSSNFSVNFFRNFLQNFEKFGGQFGGIVYAILLAASTHLVKISNFCKLRITDLVKSSKKWKVGNFDGNLAEISGKIGGHSVNFVSKIL